MNRRSLSNVNKASPVDFRLLLYGSVIGVLYGLSRLGDSADEATAQGIAMSTVVTLAIWLGLKMCRVVLLLVEKRLDSLEVRLDALLESRLGQSNDQVQDHRSARPASTVWLTIAGFCIVTTPVGIVAFTGGVIMAVIDSQVDVYTVSQYVPVLVFGASYSLICAGVQWVCLLRIDRIIYQLEQPLNSHDLINGFTLNTRKLGRAFSKMDTLVYKITGQRMAT